MAVPDKYPAALDYSQAAAIRAQHKSTYNSAKLIEEYNKNPQAFLEDKKMTQTVTQPEVATTVSQPRTF